MAAEITRKVLQLKFADSTGKEFSMNVNNPSPDVTPDIISEAMEHMIAAKCFVTDDKLAASKVGAAYIIQSADQIDLP